MRPTLFGLFLATACVLALSTPVLLWGTWQAAQDMRNTPVLWIPPENVERQQYEWFRRSFGVRDAIVISWPGCTVDDPRLAKLATALERPVSGSARAYRAHFDEVVTGYGALRELMGEPLELSRAEALQRLERVLIGRDGSTSCAVITLTEFGALHSDAAVNMLLDAVERELEIESTSCYLAGSPVDGQAIDLASTRSMNYFLVPSALLVLFLARWCLGSWRLTLIIIAVAAFGELFVLSLVWFISASMNAVLIVMAPLVFVLSVSAGIHLVNYYHDELRLHGPRNAARQAIAAGWLPSSLAAVTTGIGLISLTVSEITPIQQFGALAAAGVLTTTGLLFLLLPGPMDRWQPGLSRSGWRSAGAASRHERTAAAWRRLSHTVGRFSLPIAAVSLALLAVMGYGLTQLRTSVNVLSLLVPDSRLVQDYQWLESNIAPMVPIEVVVRMDRSSSADWLERMELLRRIEAEMRELEVLGGTMSAASFVPESPRRGGLSATVRRSVLRSQIEAQQQQFVASRFLYQNTEQQAWRITTRSPALRDVDYGQLLADLRQQVEPVLHQYREDTGDDVHATYTGMTPLIHAAQQMLLDDLITSFFTALGLVAVVMIVVLRSITAGLTAMLPNVFPATMLFGAMGWLQIPVDIGTMMTASVALGVAIDGTLHFLTWYRRETAAGVESRDAIANTYRHCGAAMSQTAVVCGLGLLVFGLSEFIPTRRFAAMMLFLLIAALAGDLLLLPALLTGPFRRFFLRRPQ